MSNSRKFRRQLEKSPYVQEQIRDQYRQMIREEARERVLFGEEKILMIFKAYQEYAEQIKLSQQK